MGPKRDLTALLLLTVFQLLGLSMIIFLTPLATGTGVKLLTCPYCSGSVMPSGMRLLPTTLPLPKATNPKPQAHSLVHFA